MKPLTTGALALALGLILVAATGCRTVAGSPGGGFSSVHRGAGDYDAEAYGDGPNVIIIVPDPDPGPAFRPGSGHGPAYGYGPAHGYGPGYGYGPGFGHWAAPGYGYRYPGDNEVCSDRRRACQKWSSKRDHYVPDYGETRRQYGRKAEKRQRQRNAD
jgi:hypothetical protein